MIGFDIGGTKCAACEGEEAGGELVIKDKRIIPTDHNITPHEMVDKMAQRLPDIFCYAWTLSPSP